MKKIIILAGGSSDERLISLQSGQAVATALSKIYQVTQIDPREGLEPHLGELKNADLVFPVLHGAGGEDGVLQRYLETNNIPYVGTGSVASKLCFDKWTYKKFLQDHNILAPQGALLHNFDDFEASIYRQTPFVLKPYDGGSSINTFIVREISKSPLETIAEAFIRHSSMLIEELIIGTEITVGVLGEQALPVIEIIPPEGGEFDYENKYNGATAELCPPQNVSLELQEQAKVLALNVHNLTGCRGMSRTDMIVTQTDQLYVLETNTIPGMTSQSLLPKAAAYAGLNMTALVNTLVENSIKAIGY